MSFRLIISVLSMLLLLTVMSCERDDVNDPSLGPPATADFTITIENVFEEKEFFANGTFGRVDSGLTVSFVVNARPGQHLSFAASLNDLSDVFIGFDDVGIDLYPAGSPLTGEITDLCNFWDAGVATAGGLPDTALIEISTAGILSVDDVIEVSLEHDGGTEFIVSIKNVTEDISLFNRVAEGVWVIHEPDQMPLFEQGGMASSELSSLSAFNSNAAMDSYLSKNSGLFSALSPGAFGLNDSLFFIGVKANSKIESLAEDGDPSGFSSDPSEFTNVFDTPIGASGPGPILPGESYSFTVSATDGDFISMGSMILESNDWFIGANYIPLFHIGLPLTGEITSILKVYDAGTEQDEFPGLGPNQAARQGGNNLGPEEDELLAKEITGEFIIPDIYDMVKVTLVAN